MCRGGYGLGWRIRLLRRVSLLGKSPSPHPPTPPRGRSPAAQALRRAGARQASGYAPADPRPPPPPSSKSREAAPLLAGGGRPAGGASGSKLAARCTDGLLRDEPRPEASDPRTPSLVTRPLGHHPAKQLSDVWKRRIP